MPELPEAERARQAMDRARGPRDRRRRRPRHLRLPPAPAGRDRRGAGRPLARLDPPAREVPLGRDGRRPGARPPPRHGGADRRSTSRPRRATGTASRSSSPTAAGSRCATSGGSAGRCSIPTSPTSARTPRGGPRGVPRAGSAAARVPLKARLLDQRSISGVGNLLADETLWQARLSPRPRGGRAGRGGARPRCAACCARRSRSGDPPRRRAHGRVHPARGGATGTARAAGPRWRGTRSAAAPRTGARPASRAESASDRHGGARAVRLGLRLAGRRADGLGRLLVGHPGAAQQVDGGRADLADDDRDGEVARALEHERRLARGAQRGLADGVGALGVVERARRARAPPRPGRAAPRRPRAGRSRPGRSRGGRRGRARGRCAPPGRSGGGVGVVVDGPQRAPARRGEPRGLAARRRAPRRARARGRRSRARGPAPPGRAARSRFASARGDVLEHAGELGAARARPPRATIRAGSAGRTSALTASATLAADQRVDRAGERDAVRPAAAASPRARRRPPPAGRTSAPSPSSSATVIARATTSAELPPARAEHDARAGRRRRCRA